MRTSAEMKGNSGGALVVALLICLILAISIGGYLAFVEQQHLLGLRSNAWNNALAVAEAGIEDGMQHLNSNFPVLAADGWAATNGSYIVTRTLPSGASYTALITQTANTNKAYITSRAAINAPRSLRGIFASAAQPERTRAIRVLAEKTHPFSAGILVENDIFLRGNRISIDSFDSSMPGIKSNLKGQYDPTIYSGDRGDVATNGGILDQVGLGNASIFGILHTGPGCAVDLGPSGGIGTHAFQALNPGKIEDGYLFDDSNFLFPDTKLPSSVGYVPPPSGSVVTVSNYFSTNLLTSAVFPSPVPAGGVITNTVVLTSLTYPFPTPEWVTTNTVVITTNYVPVPAPADLVTNVYTTNVTSQTFPGAGVDYLGGVTTNVTKGKKADTYTYNLVLYRTYSFSTFSYAYPSYTYSWYENATTTVYATNNYAHVIAGDTTYSASSISGPVIVTGKNAVLILPHGLDGITQVVIEEDASLTVYAGGNNFAINGGDWVNKGGFAGNLTIYCAPSVTKLAFNGTGQFVGVIVAPSANITMNGSGGSTVEYAGSLMCKSLTLNGTYSLHYDEALIKGEPKGPFVVVSWDEIP